MKLLVIEDEPKLGAYLRRGLSENGYVVDLVTDGVSGLHQAKADAYTLVVLDLMLPGLDGLEVLRGLRLVDRGIPVLVLTARDSIEDRVQGLEAGADDYLVKPFAFAELLARIRTLLRRGGVSRSAETFKVADLEVCLARRRVTRGAQRIDLTAKEFALLALLAARAGEVLSRSLIASQVWDMNFDSDTNVVEVAVRRLRAKIDDAWDRKLIHTMRGMGYVLEDRG